MIPLEKCLSTARETVQILPNSQPGEFSNYLTWAQQKYWLISDLFPPYAKYICIVIHANYK